MICSSCNIDKDESEFYKRESSKNGYRRQCSKCVLAKVWSRRICGIYKITSPSGRVYIGQSVDIKVRWASYRGNCSNQVKLYNSFQKYGVHKHIFEIEEECREEVLTERELYWQKHYNCVEEGLNCTYVPASYNIMNKRNGTKPKKESIVGIIREGINDIIDIETGVFYYGFSELVKYFEYSRGTLTDMLRGSIYNSTSLILGEDYENGKTPKSLLKGNIKFNRDYACKDDFIVVDFFSKEEVGSTKAVAKKLKIKEVTFRSYLNGVATNPTNYIFKKDYLEGLTPDNLCTNVPSKTKVINFETGKVFNSIKEVSKEYGISERTVSSYLKDEGKSRLPIVRFSEYDPNKLMSIPSRSIGNINRKIIDINTKEIFINFEQVHIKYNVSKDMISKYLNCKCFNALGIIYKDEYDKGLLPNHNFKGNCKNRSKKVIDTSTGVVYKSIREACRYLDLCSTKISNKLKSNNLEGITLRYLDSKEKRNEA